MSSKSKTPATKSDKPTDKPTKKSDARPKPTKKKSSLKPKSVAVVSEKKSTIDESVFDVENKHGVTLAEQSENVTVLPSDGNMATMASRAEHHLNESEWTLDKMLGRNTYVNSVSWNLTDAVGTAPGGFLPLDIIQNLLTTDIVSIPFMRFQYWRCKFIKIHLQLSASRFHQGRLIAAYLPSQRLKSDTLEVMSLQRCTSLQHAFLDPANGSVVDFVIPFDYYKGYLDLVNNDTLGQLYFYVFNQLQAATTASTVVTVKIFFSVDSNEFKIPRAGGTSFQTMQRSIMATAQSGLITEIADNLDGSLHDLIESFVPEHIVSDALSLLSLDKPTCSVNPDVMIYKDHQYMSTARNLEFIDKLTLDPAAQQMIDKEHFASSADEMELRYLTSKPTFLASFNWATTQAQGQILWDQVISPGHLMVHGPEFNTRTTPPLLGFVSNPFTYWRGGMTFVFDIVATQFHEGRLDVTYHPALDIPPEDYATSLSQYASSFAIRNGHNLFKVVCPFISDTPWKKIWQGEALSVTPTDSAFRFADYALGCIALRVSVPLKAPSTVVPNVDINIFVSGSDDYELSYISLYGNSYHVVFPATEGIRRKNVGRKPVETPTRVVSSSHNLSRANDVVDDYELIRIPRQRTRLAQAQSGTDADSKTESKTVDAPRPSALAKTDESAVPLAASRAMTSDPVNPHFGEKYLSFRECLKRYQFVNSFPISAPTDPPVLNGVAPLVYAIDAMDAPEYCGGLLAYCASMYRNMRGSMNYKFMLRRPGGGTSAGVLGGPYAMNNNIRGYVTYLPTGWQQAPGNISSACLNMIGGIPALDLSGYHANNPAMARISLDQPAEIQIPFLSVYATNLIYQNENINNFDASLFRNGQFYFVLMADVYYPEDVIFIDMYASIADETHFGTFYGTPQVQGNDSTGDVPFYPTTS